ncbi:hypothetical protein AVDCRST_MAG84-7040, partial [uncultured Microcoleus sp.]
TRKNNNSKFHKLKEEGRRKKEEGRGKKEEVST